MKELHKTNYKLHVVHCSEAWADMYSEVMEGGNAAKATSILYLIILIYMLT